jgi:putative phosphoesterase
MRKALSLHPDCEVVFFLGDGISDLEEIYESFPSVKFLVVRGNCDSGFISMGRAIPKTSDIELMSKKIVFTHGDLIGVKYGITGALQLAAESSADILLFCHTHSPVVAYIPVEVAEKEGVKLEKPVYLMNPGAIGLNGSTSYGVITLTDGEPLLSHGTFL